MLMGGATLISLPLAITSCSKGEWKTQSFNNAEQLLNWIQGLMTSKTDTKTIHTWQEYASFFYNDLTNGNLFLSFLLAPIFSLAFTTLYEGKKLKFSTIIKEHKMGFEAVNMGNVKYEFLKVELSENYFTLQFKLENIGANSGEIQDRIAENVPYQDTRVTSIISWLYTEPPLGPSNVITISAYYDGVSDFVGGDGGSDSVDAVLYILQSQFPNYTFQTNS